MSETGMRVARETSTIAANDDDAGRWGVLAAAFVIQMTSLGTTTFAYGLFVKPLATEFGISRADVNIGLMLLLVGSSLFAPAIGYALDRFPERRTILVGALLFGAGATLCAFAQNLTVLALAVFLPLSIGTAATGGIPTSALVARWFGEHRGRALGIVATSASAGGVLIVPLMSFLVEKSGWRVAVLATGLSVSAIIALLVIFGIRERPRRLDTGSAGPAGVERWTVRRLLRERDFWLLVIAVGLLLAMNQALVGSLVVYGSDRGFSAAEATALVTAVSASSVVGKLLIGQLTDLVDKRKLLAGVSVLLLSFVTILQLHLSFPKLLIGCLICGATIGSTTPVWTSLISARFGVFSFGTVMGLMVQVQMPLFLLALRITGLSFDKTGSYDRAFLIFALLAPVAFIAALLVGRPTFRKL